MTLADIYYVLFRHKWRIFLCTVAGFLAAAALYKFHPPPFASEAKLFIRYVVTEAKSTGPSGDGSAVKSPDQRGETIMDSELEILNSLDLAKRVAESVGPEKILAKMGGGKDLASAAVVVQGGLTADVPPASSVIRLVFRHPDPDIVQPVLAAVIEKYLAMHVEIHRPVGIVGDFLTQETDQLRSDLDRTEADLNKANSVAGVLSIEDAKKGFGDQISQIRQQIFSAQAEFAERSAILEEAEKRNPNATPAGKGVPDLTAALIDEYRSTVNRLNLFQTREQEFSVQFTPENPRMKEVHAQVLDAEAKKDGTTQEEWLKKHVEDATPEATEADAKKFYDENSARMDGTPFDEQKPHIVAFLTHHKRQEVAGKLFDELKSKAKIAIALEESTADRTARSPQGDPSSP